MIVFDGETGAFRKIWGTSGDPPADPVEGEVADEPNPEHFDLVHGGRVSNDGQVYVSDRAGMRLQVFSIEGEYIRQLMMGRTEPVAERVGETGARSACRRADRECGDRSSVGEPDGLLTRCGAALPLRS